MGKGGKRRAHARPPSAVRMRIDRLTREVAKFGAVGGAGLLVNLIAFNVVRSTTDLQVVRASVIATVVAIVSNYIGFRYFTYRDRDKSGRTKELTLFVLFSAVGLVIENGFLYAATYGLGLDSPLASNVFKFVGIGIATLFRFWSYRTWVFRAAPAREAVASAESFLENPEPYLDQERQAYLQDEDRPTRQFRQVQRVR
ncbi:MULTISPECIES: GtrA family protein [Streptomyces]|uniref:GtrA family protein n=2 Tax=Streptomyces TaxID=1883 RepID=A0A7T7I5Q6_9ACTN|nr:GtrA family protein [Streptomyces liliifuscus]TRO62814.1 GtrA family protein [Streptomyces sp. IB201691-2A2]